MHLPYLVNTCARTDSIKTCLQSTAMLFGLQNPLPIHDNFGDEDGIFRVILLQEKLKKFVNKIHTTSRDANRSWCGSKSDSEHRKSSEVRSGNRLKAYAEQLEFFFVANGVTDSKQKKAVLLTNLPTETYQLAKDLVAPILLREDSLMYDTIVERPQKQ